MPRSSPSTLLAGAIVSALIIFSPTACDVWAANQSPGPKSRFPRNAFWVTFTDRLGSLRTEAEEIDRRLTDALGGGLDSDKAGSKRIEDAYADVLRLHDIAEQLRNFNEPAGVDFSYRQVEFEGAILELATDRIAQPGMEAAVKRRTDDRFSKTLEKRVNKLRTQVQRLSAKKKYLAAYETLLDGKIPLEAEGIWWRVKTGQRHDTIRSLDGLHITLHEQVGKLRIEEAQKVARAAKESAKVDLNGLISSVKAAAATISESGKAETTQGAELSGPEVLEFFGNQWVDAQLKATRFHRYMTIGQMMNLEGDPDQFRQSVSQFSAEMGTALAAIIQADVDRAGPEEAAELYFSYLKKLPPILTRSHVTGLSEQLVAPLEKLISKSPELTQNVKAYRETTDDLLRWRERTAQAYVQARGEGFQPLKQHVDQAANLKRSIYTADRRIKGRVARLNKSIPNTIKDLEVYYLKKQTRVQDLLYSERTLHAVSRCQHRAFVFVRVDPALMQDATQHLAAELFAADDQLAPTLEAQLALYSARQNDVLEAGGEITEFGAIGWAARYTGLAEDDRGLVRLGPLDPEPPAKLDSTDVILLFLVRPSWLSTRYFFVAAPVAEPAADKAE